jgi:S-adenosylmethionine hydrolase
LTQIKELFVQSGTDISTRNQQMAIITLTTDMGLRDYYVGALKGAIYSQVDDVEIVDISHHIKPFDTYQAAFVLRNAYVDFPPGTIHIIGVNPDAAHDLNHLIVRYTDQYFIGADNGVFSLLFDKRVDDVFELNLSQDSDDLTFVTKNLFAKAACHLARGGTPEVIGKRIEGIRQSERFRPVIDNHLIKGTVIYIDSYGNVITNISHQLYRDVGKGRDFSLQMGLSKHDIREIKTVYNEVKEGEKLALFGSSGFLEIAINKGTPESGGGAHMLFGLKVNDTIRIEFNANQNRKDDFPT